MLFSVWTTLPALAYTTLAEAYAALGFDPYAPGNAVVVYFTDAHMDLNIAAAPAPVATTNLDYRLIEVVNKMQPPPTKIIVAGDVSSNMAVIPGADASFDPPTYLWATNEMAYFREEIHRFTNIAQKDIVWIPGNHDQGAYETNAETFCRMFPNMPPYQKVDVAGMRFFLVNSGNYGESSDSQREWLRQEVGNTQKTQEIAVVTHQRPFAGVAVHRGIAVLLRELFGDWENRWWVLDGHEHAHSMEVFDVGRSNVAQLTIGPASTNTFVGYTYDVGCTFLCISNGLAGYVYYRYWDRSFRGGHVPNWDAPNRFVAAFEGIKGLLWRRLKTPAPTPEVLQRDADNSMNWWSYTKLLEWELPLARHGNLATHFLLLAAGVAESAVIESSNDRTNWARMEATGVTNSVYFFKLPPAVAAAEKGYVRFTGTNGNNWIGGWGLLAAEDALTTGYTFPQLAQIPDQYATAGSRMTVSPSAINPYSPPDVHQFTLISGPAGAWADRKTGVFYWGPPISAAPSDVPVAVRVEDTGTPPMGMEQEFTIHVEPPPGPVLDGWRMGTNFSFHVTADSGSYSLFSSENGIDWSLLAQTNTPDIVFQGCDPDISQTQLFYRVIQTAAEPQLELPTVGGAGEGPYKLRVVANPGRFSIQKSQDNVEWISLAITNTGPVTFEIPDPENNTNTQYRLVLRSYRDRLISASDD